MATVDPREIGRRIKRAREKKHWTQLEFALGANVSPSTIARWESGKLPPVRELIRVAELLGVDADDLVDAEQDDESTASEAALQAVLEEVSAMRAEVRQRDLMLASRLDALERLLRAEPA